MSKIRLINPQTNNDVFGYIPELNLASRYGNSIKTVKSPIYLSQGKHFGPNSGFGVVHIWAEHRKEIIRSGFLSQSDVPGYVQKILSQDTAIYFEDRNIKHTRVNAVRIVAGTVILEYVRTVIDKIETPHWNIVTAYSNPRTAGVLVGQI